MKHVFVESNFLLELAFRQTDFGFCERIWQGARLAGYSLHVPQYVLGEIFQMLRPLRNERERHLHYVLEQITQHRREDKSDGSAMDFLTQQLTTLLEERTQSQTQRLYAVASQVVAIAESQVLTSAIVLEAQTVALAHGLSPQDALVYASVLAKLRELPGQEMKLFVSRNKNDFYKPEIIAELQELSCDFLFSFQAAAGRLGV